MMTRTVRPWALLFTLSFFLLASDGFARFNVWEPDNGIALRQGRHVSWVNHFTAEDGDGHFVAVWSDASRGTMDVYAQRFAMDGTPMWSRLKVMADQPYAEQEAKVVRTSDNAWIVSWLDYGEDVDKAGIGRLFLRKINDQGQDLWPAPVGPIEEATSTYISNVGYEGVFLYPSSDGGVLVGSDLGSDIWVQRITGNGDVAWEDAVHPLPNANDRPRILSDGADGLIVLASQFFHQAPSHLLGQHVSAGGELLWGEDGEPLTLLDSGWWGDWDAKSMTDGNWLLAWANVDGDVLIQKMNASAESLWDEGSFVVNTLDDQPYFDHLYPLGDEQFALSWRYDNVTSMQRVDVSGDEPAFSFNPPVALNQYDRLRAVFPVDGSNMLVQIQRSMDNDFDHVLNLLSAGGGTVWSTTIFPYTVPFDYSETLNDVVVSMLQEGTLSMLTGGQVGESDGLLLHQLSLSDGSLMLDTPAELVTGIFRGANGSEMIDTDISLFTVWSDERWGDAHYFQLVDRETGDILTEPGGRDFFPALAGRLPHGINLESALKVTPTLTGGLLALRTERTGIWNNFYIRMQKVSNRGEILWGRDGIVLENLDPNQLGIDFEEVTTFHDGSFLLTYSPYSEVFWTRVSLLKINPDGSPAWDEPIHDLMSGYEQELDYYVSYVEIQPNDDIVLIVNGENFIDNFSHTHKFLLDREGRVLSHFMVETDFYNSSGSQQISMDDGSLVLVYRSDDDILLSRYSADGERVTPEGGVVLCSAYDNVDLEDAFVLYEDSFSLLTEQEDVFHYHRFNFDGEPLIGGAEGVALTAGLRGRRMVGDNNGGAWILGQTDVPGSTDITYLHVNSEGLPARPEYETSPMVLCDAWHYRNIGSPIPDGEGGFILSWEDTRGSLIHHYLINLDVYAMRVNDHDTGVSDEPSEVMPGEFVLYPAYPNPFNPSTSIRFAVPQASQVQLSVYDILGRKVTTLLDNRVESGTHMVSWNGRDDASLPVASGTYFIKLSSQDQTQARRVVLLK